MHHYRGRIQRIASAAGVELPADWQGVDALLTVVEKLRAEGATVVFKLEGGPRAVQPWIALVLGGRLGEDFIRVSGVHLEEALACVLVNYARRFWGFSG